MIFDTGSDWLVIEGVDCKNCNGNSFNHTNSTYFERVSGRKEEKTYGSFVHISGQEVKDRVCLFPFKNCVDPMKFFLIEDQLGIPETSDGILGMAMGYSPKGFNMIASFDLGSLFLKEMR